MNTLEIFQVWTFPQHRQCSLGSYLGRVGGCSLGLHLSPEETKMLREMSWKSIGVLACMDLHPTYTMPFGFLHEKCLRLLPGNSTVSRRNQNVPGDFWEESWGATGNGPAPNIDKTLWVATLEEPGLALWEFTCLQRRPTHSWRCLGGILGSYQAWTFPQHTQCSLCSDLRSVGGCYLGILLSLEETKSAPGAAWEDSWGATGHGPASNRDKTL